MSIEVTIRVACDDLDDVMELQTTLLERYHRVRFTIDATEHNLAAESEADDDVDPEMLMSILNGMRAHVQDVAAREALDAMVGAMTPREVGTGHQRLNDETRGARDIVDRYVTTPEGMSHAEALDLLGRLAEPRVRADDSSSHAYSTKKMIARDLACPQCAAPAGQPCRTPRSVYKLGGFTHQARIDAWYER